MTTEVSTVPATSLERVLHAYIDLTREFRLISDASHMHQDRMLTWAIGLMGGGLFASLHLDVCRAIGPRALIWAASPWAAGVLCAVIGRIAGACYSDVHERFAAGEAYAIRSHLARGLDAESADHLLVQLSTEPYRMQHEQKANRTERIMRAFYYLTLVALLVGMVSVFWRIVTCQ